MDIMLARTFLEIVDCGNFVRASERLHVTQTAVSVRVQSLEEQLGHKLFVRNKAGATLTPAGEQFLRYAPLLLQVWERAKHQVAVPLGLRAVVAVGAELSLWNPFLIDWLVWMRRSTPQLALRTQVGLPEGLMNQVSEGILDLAVLYAPQHRQGLKVELLMKEKLVLVTTAKGKTARGASDYVYVDWGLDFAAQHNLTFPERANPGTYVSLGPLGLQYILKAGGSGYFRAHAVAPYLRNRRLRLVRGAPEFLYPAYVVYSEGADIKVMAPALAGLKHIANAQNTAGIRKAPRR
jgi:LysR family transcriptional regulator, flagellar master operon regulator